MPRHVFQSLQVPEAGAPGCNLNTSIAARTIAWIAMTIMSGLTIAKRAARVSIIITTALKSMDVLMVLSSQDRLYRLPIQRARIRSTDINTIALKHMDLLLVMSSQDRRKGHWLPIQRARIRQRGLVFGMVTGY